MSLQFKQLLNEPLKRLPNKAVVININKSQNSLVLAFSIEKKEQRESVFRNNSTNLDHISEKRVVPKACYQRVSEII